MKPGALRPGQRVVITRGIGSSLPALSGTFIRRVARQPGRPARNIIRVLEFAGLHGPDDLGDIPYSDYDISRRFQPADGV